MELRRLGTSGLRVSALSLGAMLFGTSQTLMKGVTSSDEEARRIFDRALEAGINLVDTANVYNEGRSEELAGEWSVGKRDQLLIATKCRFPIGWGMTLKAGPHDWGLSRKAIMTACEGSLRRLKTDVIDLYQVHMQDRNVAIDETLRALDDLVTEGKVRYIACANYAGYSLVESLWAADRLQNSPLRVHPTPMVASPALGRAGTHSCRGGVWARRSRLGSALAGLSIRKIPTWPNSTGGISPPRTSGLFPGLGQREELESTRPCRTNCGTA